MRKIILLFAILIAFTVNAQVGVGTTTPNASSALDVFSNNAGFLMPRMTSALRTAIGSPAAGLQVYDTTTNTIWFYNGTVWVNSGSAAPNSWNTSGNAGTVNATNFIGTTDNVPLTIRVNNLQAGRLDNTASQAFYGFQAGAGTTGLYNVAIGSYALNDNTTGNYNVAVGDAALTDSRGAENTGIGDGALAGTVNGSYNTAIGSDALVGNISGSRNTALGAYAGPSGSNLSRTVAIGYNAIVTASNSMVLGGTGTDAVNVGIGTTAPAAQLHTTGTIRFAGAGTPGLNKILTSDAAGNATWQAPSGLSTTLNSGQVFVGNASNVATGVAMSGDATMANTGVLTIANNAVGSAEITDNTVLNADLTAGTGGIYKGSGSLSGATTVTQGANALAFTASAVNAFNIDSNTLSVDAANNRVGVGTAAPTAQLHTTGTILFAGAGTPGLNKVLTSDAAGNATWQAPSGLSTTLNNGQVFVGNASNVATGVAMSGDATMANTGVLTIANNAVGSAEITDNTILNADLTAGTGGIYKGSGSLSGATTVTQGANALAFTASAVNAFNIDSNTLSVDAANNRVGVGTATPTAQLHTTGTILFAGAGTPGASKVLTSDATGNATWQAPSGLSTTLNNGQVFVGNASNVATGVAMSGDATMANTGVLTIANNAVGSAEITDNTILNADLTAGTGGIYKGSGSLSGATTVTQGANALAFTASAVNAFNIDSNTLSVDAANNRVGIGTATPTAQLHTTGTILFAGAGTPGASKVLTSDAAGNATWQAPSGLSTTLNSGQVFVGNASNIATAVAMSGDATMANTGVLTIANNAVGSAEITDNTVLNADLTAGTGGIYKGSGSLSGATTVTQGANALAFTASAVNAFNIDSNTLSVDAANNRVGIGTAAPTAQLHTTGTILFAGAGTPGASKVLTSDAAGNATWQAPSGLSTTLTNGQVFVGNASNVATGVAMSGDATMANTGVLTIANNAVGSAEITDNTILNADLTAGTGGIYKGSGSLSGATTVTQGANALAFTASAVNAFNIDSNTLSVDAANNRVGIGTAAPTAQLHTTGTILFAGAGTPGANKILTSDATGNATWQTPMSSGWSKTGDAGTVDGVNFIGTTDNVPFTIRYNNQQAGRIDSANTFYGALAGASTIPASVYNVGIGTNALLSNTSGNYNIAVGRALQSNISGSYNVAVGESAMKSVTTGDQNVGLGTFALINSTSGSYNTAIGAFALHYNTTGTENTAIGYAAGPQLNNLSNTTAIGSHAFVTTSNSMVLGGTGFYAVMVGIGTTAPTSKLQVVGLPVYASDALAGAGGLTAGAFYQDAAGFVKVKQ